MQAVLAEPLEDCLALDATGRPCLEVMTPLDLEAELSLPGGHIFHGDLQWPWLADDAAADDRRPSAGASPPSTPECCSAGRAPSAAVRSAVWAATTRRWPCSKPLSRRCVSDPCDYSTRSRATDLRCARVC